MVNVTKGLLLKWYVLYMCMLAKVIISKEQGLTVVVVLNLFAYIIDLYTSVYKIYACIVVSNQV